MEKLVQAVYKTWLGTHQAEMIRDSFCNVGTSVIVATISALAAPPPHTKSYEVQGKNYYKSNPHVDTTVREVTLEKGFEEIEIKVMN